MLFCNALLLKTYIPVRIDRKVFEDLISYFIENKKRIKAILKKHGYFVESAESFFIIFNAVKYARLVSSNMNMKIAEVWVWFDKIYAEVWFAFFRVSIDYDGTIMIDQDNFEMDYFPKAGLPNYTIPSLDVILILYPILKTNQE